MPKDSQRPLYPPPTPTSSSAFNSRTNLSRPSTSSRPYLDGSIPGARQTAQAYRSNPYLMPSRPSAIVPDSRASSTASAMALRLKPRSAREQLSDRLGLCGTADMKSTCLSFFLYRCRHCCGRSCTVILRTFALMGNMDWMMLLNHR